MSTLTNLNMKGLGRGALMQALAAALDKTKFIPQDNQCSEPDVVEMPVTVNPPSLSSTADGPIKTTISKLNSKSEKVNLIGACVRLLKTTEVEVYEYEVCFEPPVDVKATKNQLIDSAVEAIDVPGLSFSFDGTKLRVSQKLSDEVTSVEMKLPNTDSDDTTVVKVVLKYIGLCLNSELIHHYNSILNSILTKLNMHQIMRSFYPPKNIVNLPNHKVEVWQGYDTGFHECEDGFLLQFDVVTKVVHVNSVMDLLTKCYYQNRGTFKQDFEKQIKGFSVMTKYNNKSYRVDEITWDMNPTSTFELSNGEKLSFLEYYKRTYNREIKDPKQPLLVHKKLFFKGGTIASDISSESKNQEIFLIPEFCYLMGFTDEMRGNNKLMQNINFHTRVTPNLHKTRVQELIASICNNEETKTILNDWGLSLDTSLIPISARLMKPEVLTIGGQKTIEVNNRGAWAKEIEDQQVLSSVPLKEWAVIFTEIDAKEVREFCEIMCDTFFNMGVECKDLKPIEIPNDDVNSYLEAAKELVFDTDVQVLIFIVPDDFEYANVLKTFCLETDVAFEVISLKRISDAQKLHRVTQEISRQIECKLGGELWSVHIPHSFFGTMVCGIDTFTRRENSNVVGFVATYNQSFTKWHSSVAYQEEGEELIDCLSDNFINAFKKYIQVNNVLPKKIVIYRAGGSEALFTHVLNYEVEKVKEILCSLREGYTPETVVIVVQKTRTRLYLETNDTSKKGMVNPLPGTIIDNTVTSGCLHDFFLISRSMNQGVVPPTRYVIMYNTSLFNLEDLQLLSLKLTHLCYKQPCSAGFPAPIMYAHDIAHYYCDITQSNGIPVSHNTFYFF